MVLGGTSSGGPVWWGAGATVRGPNVHICGSRSSKTPPKFIAKTRRDGILRELPFHARAGRSGTLARWYVQLHRGVIDEEGDRSALNPATFSKVGLAKVGLAKVGFGQSRFWSHTTKTLTLAKVGFSRRVSAGQTRLAKVGLANVGHEQHGWHADQCSPKMSPSRHLFLFHVSLEPRPCCAELCGVPRSLFFWCPECCAQFRSLVDLRNPGVRTRHRRGIRVLLVSSRASYARDTMTVVWWSAALRSWHRSNLPQSIEGAPVFATWVISI